MGLFDTIAGGLVSGIFGSLGSKSASRQESQAVQTAQQAANPLSVFSPTGYSVFDADNQRIMTGLNQQLGTGLTRSSTLANRALGNYFWDDFGGKSTANVQREVGRLGQLRAPSIANARASLQSQLLNRGRLGLGVGGGLSGRAFNPEVAGQEEAILRAQLGDIGYAQDRARQRKQDLLWEATGLFNLSSGISGVAGRDAALGIAARVPGSIAALQAQPGFNQGASTRNFFSGLGTTLGGAIESQGSRPQTQYPTVYGRDGYGQYF